MASGKKEEAMKKKRMPNLKKAPKVKGFNRKRAGKSQGGFMKKKRWGQNE